jgi:transcriptional regulator with XRE-family HTH domain
MPDSLGARLRQRREQQGIALATIAEETKIKPSLLDALERDDVSRWPSGIFRRAFVRAYAHAIGLDPDVVVREFLELYPDPAEVVEAFQAASDAEGASVPGGPPTRLRYLVGSAIDSLSRLRKSPAVEKSTNPYAHPAMPPANGMPALPVETHPPDEPVDEPVHSDWSREPASDNAAATGPIPSDPEADVVTDPASEPARVEGPDEAVAAVAPAGKPASIEPDFAAVADLCTELGRVQDSAEVKPLLQEAARILDAIGIIVWVWDGAAARLRPALAYGYSDRVVAQLPSVRRDADNWTAAAFRSARTYVINGDDHASGAVVAPLLTPAGCAGVLAIELPHGNEPTRSVIAAATIFAAQLGQLTGDARAAEPPAQTEPIAPPASSGTRRFV